VVDVNKILIEVAVTGSEDAVQKVERVEQTVARASKGISVPVTLDDEDMKRKLALYQNETARMRAQKLNIPLEMDDSLAKKSLQEITLLTRQYNATVARARIDIQLNGAKETENALGSLADKLVNIAAYSGGYQAFRQFENAVGAAGQAVVGFNAQLEQMNVAFSQALGGQTAAADFLQQLQQFALRTPFQFGDLTKFSQQLLGMGIAAKDIIPDMTAIGNAVAGVGGNADVLQRVVTAIGQINAAGKANAQDLRQLSEAGIPAYQMLANVLNTDVAGAMKRVTAGTVDSATAINALISGMNERFGGLMEQQSKTFLGRLSNLKDAFNVELADLGKPLFSQISEGLDQVAQFIQSAQFKQVFAGIAQDVGDLLTVVSLLAKAFSEIPAPLITTAIHMAELATAMKLIEVAYTAVRSVLAPTIALFTAQNAQLQQQNALLGQHTALTTADTTAREANAAATTEQIATGEAATVAQKAEGAAAATGGGAAAAGKGLLGRVTPALTGLGEMAVPAEASAGVATAAGAGLAAIIGFAIANVVDAVANTLPALVEGNTKKAVDNMLKYAPGTPWGAYNTGRDILQRVTGIDTGNPFTDFGGGSNSIASQINRQIEAANRAAQTPRAPLATTLVQNLANQAGVREVQDLLNQVATGQKTVDEATQSFEGLKSTFGGVLTNANDLTNMFYQGLNPAMKQFREETNATQAAIEKFNDERLQAGTAQAQGASEEDINRAIYGVTGTGVQATSDQVQRAKQNLQDLANAWKAAGQAAQSVNLSQGIQGLVTAAPALDKAVTDLQNLGQANQALSGLKNLADSFKAIADATDTASESYRGYLALFDDTDKRVAALDDLKKKLDEQVASAKEAQKIGVATPEQLQILREADTIYANIAGTRQRLVSNQAGDILGIAGNFPDYEKTDSLVRGLVGNLGGPQQLEIQVESNMKDVQKQVDDLVNGKHEATVNVKLVMDATGLPSWVVNALGTAGGYLPAGGSGLPVTNQPYGGVGFGGPTGTQYTAGSTAGTGDAGFSQYSSYLSKFAGSPINNVQAYATLLKVSQDTGVDPRQLLAIMQTESGFGSNAGKIGQVYNYGGMGVNNRGYSFDSGIRATDGGPEYAGYSSYENFLRDIAGWIKQYGTSFSNYQTADQGQGKAGAFQQISAAIPALGTPGQVTSNATQAVNDVGNQIVALALQSVGKSEFIDQCEAWVEKTINAILGPGADPLTGQHSATTAFNAAKQQGLTVDKAQAQPGDLVYYPDASGDGHVAIYMGGGKQVSTWDKGDPSGVGGQIHTEDIGAGAQFVHIPGVGAVNPLSLAGGVAGATAGAYNIGGVNFRDPNTPDAQAAAARAKADEEALKQAIMGATAAQGDFNAMLGRADPRNIANIEQEMQTLLPIMEKIAKAKLAPDATDAQKQTAMTNAVGQTLELTTAWGDAIDAIDSGTGDLAAQQQKIADIASGPVADALNTQLGIMEEMKQTGDQIAALQQRKTDLTNQENQVQRQQQDQDRARQAQQTQIQRAEQDADRERQRDQTLQSRAIQDQRDAVNQAWQNEQNILQEQNRLRDVAHQLEMRRIQDETTAENDRYTVASNAIADQERALQHYGTQVKQMLTDEKTALDTSYTNQTAQRSAQGQLFTAQARGATTNEGANQYGLAAAVLKDTQANADELYKTQSDNLQKQMDAEDKAAADQLYNLETQRIAEDRAHQQALEDINNQSTAMQRAYDDETNRLADEDAKRQISHQMVMNQWAEEDKTRQRQSEDEQFNIETQRLAEQRASEDEQTAIETTRIAQQRQYEDAQKAIDDEITGQQNLQKEEQDRLQAAQNALSVWQSLGDQIGNVGSSLASVLSGATGNPVPTKAGGGYVSGMAIVGDSPSGDMSTAEVVVGNFSVLSHSQSVARGYIPGGNLTRYVSGTNPGSGDVYTLNFHASGNSVTDEQMFNKLTQWVSARDRQKDIQVRRNGIAARAASQGNPRY